MNFLDFDLGRADSLSVAMVRLTGVESDVLLMRESDVSRYRASQSVEYWGGHYKASPIQIRIPSSGNWHVIVIPGLGGQVRASVQLIRQAGASGMFG